MNKPMRMFIVALAIAVVVATNALAIEYFVKTQEVIDGYAKFMNYETYIEAIEEMNITAPRWMTAEEALRAELCGG